MFQRRERLLSKMGDEQEKLLDEALGIVKVKLKISRANLDAFLT